MATLKYKTPEGEWKKVSIGGGGSTEEVYVGSDAPTDENVKVWIDPTGTPSQPSQPSAGVEVIDNLESDSTTAALSANQGRVLKEKMVVLRELLQGDSEEIKAYNLETLRLVKEGKAIVGSGGQVFDTYREREFRGVADFGNGSLITVVFKVSEDGLLSTEMQYAAMPIVLDPDRPESFMDFKSAGDGSFSVPQVYIYGPPHSPVVNIVSTGNEWWFFYFTEGAYVKAIWTDDGEFVDTVMVMNIP